MALYWPRLLVLLLLYIFSTRVDALITLNNELKNFIPACAQICFVSFLESSFPTDTCTQNPTLDCLCSSNSASGFTVGEGAIQCIISEKNIGFCKGEDAENGVTAAAFNMCNGKKDAIPNTHRTITANVVIQTDMPSIVLFAPLSTTATTSSGTSSRSSSTSSSTSSRTSSSQTSPSTTLATSTLSPVKASDISTATPSAEASAAEKAGSTPTLTKNKIVAISVGSAGGAAILAGLIILFICLRRRRNTSRDSDMLPFQEDPRTPGLYSGFRGPTETKYAKSAKFANGTWGKKAPQIPPRIDTSNPYMFSRSSIKPDTIGVAISPERNVTMEAKRNSRLLPEKPTLNMSTKSYIALTTTGLRPPPPIQLQFNRESTATQFEEDDESASTAVEDSYGRASTEPILEQQASLQTIKVLPKPNFRITNPDPDSSPESQVKTVAVGRGIGSFSRPAPNAYNLQPPPDQQYQHNRSTTAGSSIYSSAANTPYTAASSVGPFSFPLPPLQTKNMYQNQNPPQPPAQNISRKRTSYDQTGPYDRNRASNGSFTSFDSADSSPDKEYPRNTIMLDLSPVAESPASVTGRSPVSYPKFAKAGRLSQQTIRMVPPPAQPDFASVFSSGGGRTQPNDPRQKPWQVAEKAAARERRVSQNPNQSQRRSQTLPLPQPQQQSQQVQTPQRRPSERHQPKLASPFNPQPRAPPSSHQRQRSREYIAPSAHFNTSIAPSAQLRPGAHLRNTSQTPSISSFQSASTSSSLLAKRLGAEKAAQLALTANVNGKEGNAGKNGWRVLDREDRERAKEAGWRPQIVGRVANINTGAANGGGGRNAQNPGGGNTQNGGGGGGMLSPKSAGLGREYGGYESAESDLPRTPGWVPRLTPTRRGDELFLSVA